MDDIARPANFKRHNFSPRPFTTETARKAREKSRAVQSVKQALLNAFDQLGNQAFFVELGRGSGEDRRCLAMILAKLLPIEVQGALDATLTVKVVSMVGGEAEIDITRLPKDAVPGVAVPIPPRLGRAPAEDDAADG